jgi:SAM-dependent methyltransferase
VRRRVEGVTDSEPIVTHGFVESVSLDATRRLLNVRGWALVEDRDPIDGLTLSCAGREFGEFQLDLGLASPDVQSAHPGLPGAFRARFALSLTLDEQATKEAWNSPVAVTPLVAGRRARTIVGSRPVEAGLAERVKWFRDHYDWAAQQVVGFLRDGGVTLDEREVADVGCGDGITDLGVVHLAKPKRLVGFDIVPTDPARLRRLAVEAGIAGDLPSSLEFRTSGPTRLPRDDSSLDVVFTWSAFEHMQDPIGVAEEIRRVLRSDGTLMVQVWPFFHAKHGSHLWHWFPDGFDHLLMTPSELAQAMRDKSGTNVAGVEGMIREYDRLNRMTVDDLQRSLLAAGFRITRFELITEAIDVPRALERLPLSRLGIGGVKLLAVPEPRRPRRVVGAER